MAIAYDATSEGGGTGTTSTSHTCTGSDRALVVGVISLSSSDPSVTYNGVALTKVSTTRDMGPGSRYLTLWILVAPASGANTLEVAPGSGIDAYYEAASYTGCNGTQPDASAGANNNSAGTTYSSTVTSTVDNCWHVAIFHSSSTGAMGAGADTVMRNEQSFFFGRLGIFDKDAAISPAGSNTLNFTCGNGIRGTIGLMLAPGSGGGGGAIAVPPTLLLMGVG